MLTLRRVVRGVGRRLTRAAGFELVRRGGDPLERLRAAGVGPATVIDVGAALGDWSRATAAVYPEARYVLVEPLAEFHEHLETVARMLPRGELVRAAAADDVGATELNVHRDLVGSSLLREQEGKHVDGTRRSIATTTIDTLVRERGLEPPYLLKIDVQGAERQVLAGAREALAGCAAVHIEVSFFSFFHEGTPFDEIVRTLREAGLVAYDVAGLSYRPLDGALAQADLVFVPDTSPARSEHVYASPAQRAVQDEEFAAAIGRRIGREG